MDSAEVNGGGAHGMAWMTAFHEDDPNFSGTDTALDSGDLDPNGGMTRLANDIFPDDLFTPGTRVHVRFRTNFDTQVPTVIIHGNWDISTPLENALELVPHFKRSRFVLVNGGTHGALGEAMAADSTFREALMRFYRTGEMSGVPSRVDLPAIEWEIPEIRAINDEH